MEHIISILTALSTFLLFGLGVMSMFAPAKMLKNFSIKPIGDKGLSTIRSVIGGLFLGNVAIIALGFLQGHAILYLAPAITLSAVVFGRIVSFALDGFERSLVPAIIVELIIISVLISAYLVNIGSL